MTTEAQPNSTPAAAPAPKEPVTPEVPNQKKPEEDFSSKFAALSKKERIARLQQANLKREKEAFEKARQEFEAQRQQWENEFKETPLEAIKKRGRTYEDLTKAALNDGKFDAEVGVKETRSEIERLRQEMAERDKKAQEDAQKQREQAEQQAVETFKASIGDHIEANKDKYELVSLYEANELVFQTVEEHYKRTAATGKPKVLSVDEACSLVESYLEKEIERTATTSKKFQAKYQAIRAKEEANADPKKPHSSPTINNNMQPTSSAPSLLSPKTEDDRLRRAMAALDRTA